MSNKRSRECKEMLLAIISISLSIMQSCSVVEKYIINLFDAHSLVSIIYNQRGGNHLLNFVSMVTWDRVQHLQKNGI